MLLLPATLRAGIVVNLGKLELELGPDGRTTRELEIANPGGAATAVKVFVADWKQDATGAVEAVDPSLSKMPDSAAAWLGVTPQLFVLQKGEKKVVTVSFATPKPASAMLLKEYRAMVFAETSETHAAQSSAPGRELEVRVIGRIGTKIFVRNPQGPLKRDCAVTKVAEATQGGHRGLEIQVQNEGNVHVESEASTVAIRDQSGRTLETIPVGPFSILIGQLRTVFVELPEPGKSKLEPGQTYNALTVIDYGGSDLVAGELEFTY